MSVRFFCSNLNLNDGVEELIADVTIFRLFIYIPDLCMTNASCSIQYIGKLSTSRYLNNQSMFIRKYHVREFVCELIFKLHQSSLFYKSSLHDVYTNYVNKQTGYSRPPSFVLEKKI